MTSIPGSTAPLDRMRRVRVSSPSPSLPISAATIACVPHSVSAAIRTNGNALRPFFPAYPKYAAFSSLSGASMPKPSTAIRRRPASHAPFVDRIAHGTATRS